MSLRAIGVGLLAACGLFGAGWAIGASGRTSTELALGDARRLADVLTVRAETLEGRADVTSADFGAAQRHFEASGRAAVAWQRRWREAGQGDRAGGLEILVTQLADAVRRAAAHDPSAAASASEALHLIDAVDGSPAAR